MALASPCSVPHPGSDSALAVDEPVLLEGSQGWHHFLSWPGAWVFALLALTHRYTLGRPTPLLVAGGALFLFFSLRYTGRFQLTSKRLIWRPRFGEPVQVPLDSSPAEGLSALPAWGEVRVKGERTVTVRHVGQAGRLAGLIELHRRRPFLGTVDGTTRVGEVSVLPARRVQADAGSGRREEPGVAVLRPGYAAFLPAHRHAEVFHGLVGANVPKPDADVTVELLVEQMRQLSEAEFDVRMREVVLASGGELWHADEMRSSPASVSGQVYWLGGARGSGMELRPDATWSEATDRIVRRWAA
jgi:hypothetical protein